MKITLNSTLILSLLLSVTQWIHGQERAYQYFPIPPDYTFEREVIYSNTDTVSNKLDIYFTTKSEDPLPLIIWIHGGAWRGGDKRSARFARELLGQGYAVASINYRLSGKAKFPAQIIDCKSAIRWLRANAAYYNIDPNRFAAWGGSAGSHLAALLGTAEDMEEWEEGDLLGYSSRVQAVIDWFGPTDFSRMNDTKGRMDHLAEDSPESQLIGAAVKDHPDLVAYANPITYVNKHNPPFQIYHGRYDSLVIPGQAVLLNDAFLRAGLKPDFGIFDDLAHGDNNWNNYIPAAKAFLDTYLMKSLKARPQPPDPAKRWRLTYMTMPANLEYHMFRSPTIGKNYSFLVFLPPSYNLCPKRRYPVIYWLPGRGGDPKGVTNYAEMYRQAIFRGEAPEAIIVGVNGINSSMYTDSRTGEFPIEAVMVNDLIPYVDDQFRTVPVRELRAIDGFSMGGFGAAKIGFQHSDIFGVISIVGGAMHRPATLRSLRPEIFREVFDNDMEYAIAESPWSIIRDMAGKLPSNTRIRQIIGEQDRILYQKNIEFHELMDSLGIDHEFKVIPGARHNYNEVYKNWEGYPFQFYMDAFNYDTGIELYDANRAKSRVLPDYSGIAYGNHERQVFDLWLAPSDQPTPLVIFVHGGGFRQGDKSIVYNHELNELLYHGISVASINYRLYPDNHLPAAFHDGKKALQFIRAHAANWNIDKDQIGVFGGSAGAQMSMWLAYHDDMADPESSDPVENQSTRVLFAGSKGGQITMDPMWWLNHLPGPKVVQNHRELIDNKNLTDSQVDEIIVEISTIAHVSEDDPVIYASYGNQYPGEPVPLIRSRIRGWQAHNVVFGLKLKELAGEKGAMVILDHRYADTPVGSIVDIARLVFKK